MNKHKNEKIIMKYIADYFNQGKNLCDLEEIINNLWSLKQYLGNIIEYNLLFHLHIFFERKSNVIKLKKDSLNVNFYTEKETIEIIDYYNEKKLISI